MIKLTLSLIVFLLGITVNAQENAQLRHIGEFYREGEYVKDNFIIKEKDTYHLFYNVGDASPTQDWQEPNNEKAFGHATSKDLKNWQHHPRILQVIPDTWEGQVVSAPSVLKFKGLFYMVYSGFDNRVIGKQSIGLATSKDLFNWERCKNNPVITAPEWTMVNPNGWIDFRDAHIIRYGNEFLLFTMTTTKEGKGAIALASSKDAEKWTDMGPALITFSQPESPRVFEHKGTFYMFATSSLGRVLYKTKNPKSNNWTEVPFVWPTGGLWSGWEVVEEEGRTIFSAFQWKMNGNFIRYWDIDWHGETPVVKY
jgi:sucrose-6-phosphate hydrolase SacC (GH32 family)